jgi:hypothetical protein
MFAVFYYAFEPRFGLVTDDNPAAGADILFPYMRPANPAIHAAGSDQHNVFSFHIPRLLSYK